MQVCDLVANLASMKGGVKIGELLTDDKLVQAVIEAGGTANDIIEVFENYEKENTENEEDEEDN